MGGLPPAAYHRAAAERMKIVEHSLSAAPRRDHGSNVITAQPLRSACRATTAIRFPYGAVFAASSFQAFVGNYSPELLQLRGRRLIR